MRFALSLLVLAVVVPGVVLVLAIAPLGGVASLLFLCASGIQSRHLYRILVRKDYSSITGLDDKPLSRPQAAAKWWIVADSLVVVGGILAFAAYWLGGTFAGAMAAYVVLFILPALLLRIVIAGRFRAKAA